MESTVVSRNGVAAGAGFAVALGLIAAVELFSLKHSRRVESDIDRLVHQAERSTYLIGDIGQLLCRLQVHVMATLTEDVPPLEEARATFHVISDDLQRGLAELTSNLSVAETEVWRATEPEIAALRTSLGQALDLVESGRAADAKAVLDKAAGRTRRVFDSLHFFLDFNQIETKTQLNAATDLLVRTRTVQSAVAVLLFIGTAVVGFVAMRVIRRKDAEMESYLEGMEREHDLLVAFAGRVAYELPAYSSALRAPGSPWSGI